MLELALVLRFILKKIQKPRYLPQIVAKESFYKTHSKRYLSNLKYLPLRRKACSVVKKNLYDIKTQMKTSPQNMKKVQSFTKLKISLTLLNSSL